MIIGGVAAASTGMIAGAVFTVAANGKASGEKTQWNVVHAIADGTVNCTRPGSGNPALECEKLNALVDDKDLFSNLALWSFVGGGAAALGTFSYYLVTRSSSTTEGEHVHIVPFVTAEAGGVVVGGVF